MRRGPVFVVSAEQAWHLTGLASWLKGEAENYRRWAADIRQAAVQLYHNGYGERWEARNEAPDAT
jgi:hypothetical protein